MTKLKPAPRSPERQALADAIARYEETSRLVAKIKAAQHDADEKRWQAAADLERAEDAQKEAEGNERGDMVARILGEAPTSSISSHDARLTVEAASRVYEDAKRLRTALDERLGPASMASKSPTCAAPA
jgi:hypothetical protein